MVAQLLVGAYVGVGGQLRPAPPFRPDASDVCGVVPTVVANPRVCSVSQQNGGDAQPTAAVRSVPIATATANTNATISSNANAAAVYA